MAMKYVYENFVNKSEEQIHDQFNSFECKALFKRHDKNAINMRLCPEYKYFNSEHPTIVGISYCEFHTDFDIADDISNWWLCEENDFCNEDWIDQI